MVILYDSACPVNRVRPFAAGLARRGLPTDAYGNPLPIGPGDAERADRERYAAERNAAADDAAEWPVDWAAVEARQHQGCHCG